MLKFFKKKPVVEIEKTLGLKLDELNQRLQDTEIGSEEYYLVLEDIKFISKYLVRLRTNEHMMKEKKERLEPQVKAALITTIGSALASIAGIIIIRDYEAEDGIFVSSAKNFIKRM